MTSRADGKQLFRAALVLLVAGKLWLVRGEEIIGSATQYDALWYVRSAAHWYWGSSYDWTAFVRPAVYPLWLASVHLLHFPQRLAIELLQLGGALALCAGLRAVGIPRLVAVLSFAAIALQPAGFQLDDYTMSDTLYAALLWWLLGGLLGTFATRRRWIAAATGVCFALLWNTREEGLLLVGLVMVWACLFFARDELRVVARLLGTFAAVAVAGVLLFYGANEVRFRSFARSEMTAPGFQALFHSLLRIRPAQPMPYAPITNDTLHRAFAVSRTFAKLQPYLDGPLGESWRVETFRQTAVPHEIGAGWIVWATRQAASQAGLFKTPRTALGFFRKSAREINAACADGRLPTRFVVDGFLDPFAQTGGLERLPRSALRVSARVFAQWPIRPITDDSILRPEETSLYDGMTLRRAHGSNLDTPSCSSAAENAIGHVHWLLQIALHLGAVAAVWAVLWKGWRRSAGYLPPLLLLVAAVLPRLALFSWLDATAFDSTQDRFLFPVLPLWSVSLVLVIGCAFARTGRDETRVALKDGE
ncbi:MAG: hypothetical protein ACR2ID_00585 [Chthoniobacterales bacterium]